MFESMWDILLELAPWLLVGVAVAALLHVVVPADFMRRHLAGRWGVLKAAAIGVPLPLCSCSVIPVGLSLRQHGASRGAALAFLISTPQTGVDSILVSAGLLGWPFALFKMASALVLGLVGGATADAFDEAGERAPLSLPIYDGAPTRRRWEAFSDHALMLLRTIWRWLALGVVASAAISHFLPANSLAQFGGGGGLWAMLLALVIGMPLYVCAVASVPIAAALVHGGFPASAALVFLIAGPASNVATMGAVYRGLGRRSFVIYMLTVAAGSVLAGWLFQSVLDPGVVDEHAHVHGGHHSATPWATGSAIALLLLMGWFAWRELRDAIAARSAKRAACGTAAADSGSVASSPTDDRIEVSVGGMSCQSCVSRLTQALRDEEGVAAVSVTLHPGRAVVRGDVTREQVRKLIEGAGFQAM
jgi:uncharacterized membrane protein YraQ (UPF0718 family)/copper chaperone CopZ